MKLLKCMAQCMVLIGIANILSIAQHRPATPPKPIRVLLIDGESAGPYHAWKITTQVMQQELEETGMFQVVVATVPARIKDLQNFHPDFEKYQAIVMNYDAPDWPADLRASFEQFVQNGGGLVIVHAADNSFPDWPAYNQMIGIGGWRGRTEKAGPLWFWKDGKLASDATVGSAGSHGNRLPFQLVTRAPEHPIMKGLPPVWMHAADELYATLRGPGEHMTVLATAHSDLKNRGTGEDEPMLMVLSYGKGRVFHTTLGHDAAALSCVGFVTIFQRGTEWAATGKVTQKFPTNFPTANAVSYRVDLAAIDPSFLNGASSPILQPVSWSISPSVQSSLGMLEDHSDIGNVLHPGSATYLSAEQTYTLTGAGENMWLGRDAFQFAWKKVSGDVSITADLRFTHTGGNPHRKAALLMRQSLEPNAAYADAAIHSSGLMALQFRSAKDGVTASDELPLMPVSEKPVRLRLDKRGDHVTMFVSTHGEPLHFSGASTRLPLDGPFYIGLGVCAHDKDATEQAVFSHVEIKQLTSDAIDKPALHSSLQTVSIDPDAPRFLVAHASPGHFEAPNWSRDGKSLIFEQDGRILTVPAEGGVPRPIETGQATGCNGSHGLSPDGKWLAISCNTPGAPDSRVYIVPSQGGTPRMVTQNPSSYFHSWSPDGKTIAFTRPHPGGGDIWSISVEGEAETRLTTSFGVSDDPDYTPDGKYIYFNSDRAGGTMQIWRMKADGSEPKQITFDTRNNWTPHISPDGQWMVYLSYDGSITGHPANKDIALRLMSLSDNKVRDLANIFGGAGTINVPSWSPDSRQLAFVSYEFVSP